MAVIDVFTWNGEHELFELHYQTLKDVVDEFVVIEFDRTFSGQEKESLFPFQDHPKVTYRFLRETDYEKYYELANSSPNTQGAAHWVTEFAQKESIKDALTHLKDTDMVFIGDVDEIWEPELALLGAPWPVKLKLRVYTYYLNNRSTEHFWGTLWGEWGDIKGHVLNHLRSGAQKTDGYGGWHFTSMGGAEALKKKLTDSYTQESYATPEVLENVAYNVENQRDFLGRDFIYTIDESEWPEFLRENKKKYGHLCKPSKTNGQ